MSVPYSETSFRSASYIDFVSCCISSYKTDWTAPEYYNKVYLC